MMKIRTTTFALALSFAASSQAPLQAAPRRDGHEDIEKLKAELAAQRALLTELLELQQVQLQAMIELVNRSGGGTVASVPLPDLASARGAQPVKPPVPAPSKPPLPKPERPPVAAPIKAPVARRPESSGRTGTLAGKVTLRGADAAWVYVADVEGAGGGSATMVQKDKQFSPRVLVVQRGTRVEFPNTDPIFHNVFSVTTGASFDLGGYPQGESRSVVLARAGQVNVFCNIHPQMIGYVLVTPGPHYAKVARDGSFRLEGVPAGRHRVVAWAPEASPSSQEIDIPEGGEVTADFTIAASGPKSHPRKDGTPYGSYNE